MRYVRTYHSAEASAEVAEPVGGGAAEILVAAFNALEAVKARADYVCDGVDDQVEINLACAFGGSPAGLPVRLSDGDFTITGTVVAEGDIRGSNGTAVFIGGTTTIGFWGAYSNTISDLFIQTYNWTGPYLEVVKEFKNADQLDIYLYNNGNDTGMEFCGNVRNCVISGASGQAAIRLDGETMSATGNQIWDCEASYGVWSSGGFGIDDQTIIGSNLITCAWGPSEPFDVWAIAGFSDRILISNNVIYFSDVVLDDSFTGIESGGQIIGNLIWGGAFNAKSYTDIWSYYGSTIGNVVSATRPGASGRGKVILEQGSICMNNQIIGTVDGLLMEILGDPGAQPDVDCLVQGNWIEGNGATVLKVDSSVNSHTRIQGNNFLVYAGSASVPVIDVRGDGTFMEGNVIDVVTTTGWSSVIGVASTANLTRIVGNTVLDIGAIPFVADSGTNTSKTWANDGTNGDNWRN